MNTRDPEELAEAVAAQSKTIGLKLALRGRKVSIQIQLLRFVAAVVGIVAILVAYVPAISQLVGPNANSVVSLVAALTLIFTSLFPLVISRDPPERFMDYSSYILSYDGRIRQIIADTTVNKSVRLAKLSEVTRIANRNIEDCVSKWPWVEDQKRANDS